jgi:hypothetical protein
MVEGDNTKANGGRNTIMKSPISIIKSLAIAMTITAVVVATSLQASPKTEKSLTNGLAASTPPPR